ncbi:MAG: hypothetical protein ABW169_16650, partial [Sphingobium sp.]
MTTIAPITGWMLDEIVRLDQVRPGFAGAILRASAERRQVVASYLATVQLEDHAAVEAADFLTECGHRTILHLAYDKVPTGLRSALRKSGPQPFEKGYYRRLFDMLNSGQHHIVIAIMHSPELNPEKLAIIADLPSDLCDIRIVDKVKDVAHAGDLVLAMDFLERRKLPRERIVQALRQSVKINDTIKRWSLRMPFPHGPIPPCA